MNLNLNIGRDDIENAASDLLLYIFSTHDCYHCDGTGKYTTMKGKKKTIENCDSCGGTGQEYNDRFLADAFTSAVASALDRLKVARQDAPL